MLASGAAAAAVSPTIPRLNDQGNYYNDGTKQYQQQGYDQYHDGSGYYYPQEGGGYDANGNYYDENGYYYDGATGQPIHTGYEAMPPPQQQQMYHPQQGGSPSLMSNPLPPLPPSGGSPDIHKPDAANR